MTYETSDLGPQWARVTDVIVAAGRNPERIIRRALADHVSPEVIIEGYRRAQAIRASLHLGPQQLPPFEEFEAVPPGAFDPRMFNQSTWWLGYWRVPSRISEMTSEQLQSAIDICVKSASAFAISFAYAYGDRPPKDPMKWLNRTELLHALRAQLVIASS